MIDLAVVKERVDATPFRPFKLDDRRKQIQIVTPDHLLFAPESRDLLIAFEPGGNMHLLTTDQLASLEVGMQSGTLRLVCVAGDDVGRQAHLPYPTTSVVIIDGTSVWTGLARFCSSSFVCELLVASMAAAASAPVFT
jgi:hypothetical protein